MTTSDIEPLPSPLTEAAVIETAVPAVIAADTTAVDESWKTKLRDYGFVSALVVLLAVQTRLNPAELNEERNRQDKEP